jgi:hypothetical protein
LATAATLNQNVEAYNAFLQGNFTPTANRRGLPKAIGYYEEAIRLTRVTRSPTKLSTAAQNLAVFGSIATREGQASYQLSAKRALSWIQQIPDAHLAAGSCSVDLISPAPKRNTGAPSSSRENVSAIELLGCLTWPVR